MDASEALIALRAFVGRETIPPFRALDPVNGPMIRHWAEAMGDANPVYVDAEAARRTGRSGTVAPPPMLQVWAMRGYAATVAGPGASATQTELLDLLASLGCTSIVATDMEQEYLREVHPGDHLTVTEVLESVSERKTTALGSGYFLTMVKTFRDETGETVGRQRWRTLRFAPAQAQVPVAGGADAERPRRPRPAITVDNAFWFEAANRRELVIQRCSQCGVLRHPPGPCCPACLSFDWDVVAASGRGRLHSYVVSHHPQVAAFDYPLLVGLIELDEGVRLVANLIDITPDDVETDIAVELEWLQADENLTLPAFRRREGKAG